MGFPGSSSLLSVAVINTLTKGNLQGIGFNLAHRLHFIILGSWDAAGKSRKQTIDECCSWASFRLRFGYLSYRTQAHLPRDGPSHSRRAFPQ